MWNSYIAVSTAHPFAAAFAQFALLGTIGELLARSVRERRLHNPFKSTQLLLKIFFWGLLGIYIKVMFLTAAAGVGALPEYGIFSASWLHSSSAVDVLAVAFFTSTLMNVFLGPSMMLLHRLTDNLIDRLCGLPAAGWNGIRHSLLTLLWLWIPLHTFTFSQPKPVRIGIAAVLSLVLGVVMGYFSAGRGKAARAC